MGLDGGRPAFCCHGICWKGPSTSYQLGIRANASRVRFYRVSGSATCESLLQQGTGVQSVRAPEVLSFSGNGTLLFFERNYEEALVWLQRAIDEAPFAKL